MEATFRLIALSFRRLNVTFETLFNQIIDPILQSKAIEHNILKRRALQIISEWSAGSKQKKK